MSHFPKKKEVLEYIRSSPNKVGKREIARAFGLKGNDRVKLKALLRELAEEGHIKRGHKRKLHDADRLPPVSVIDIIDQDTDGELLGRPAQWESDAAPPLILLAPGEGTGKQGHPALGIGNRVLARLKYQKDGSYEARVIKRLGQSAHKILGVFRDGPEKGEARIKPVDRKTRYEISVSKKDSKNAQTGDLVTVEVSGRGGRGLKQGRVLEVLGNIDDHRSISLIAIHAHGIPVGFSEEEEAQAANAKPITLGARTDLREIPLVTIDPADARDFDDAVCALPDDDAANEGGWIVYVAIADVAQYVTSGSPLDEGARLRGNSCYFPDRVVPMLPETLSNNLCSLRPREDRPCMAVRMVFDKNGEKKSHKFLRGLMHSHARLSYEQAQAAIDGHTDDTTAPILKTILKPLWAAYKALSKARDRRGPLELEVPEHKIKLGDDGRISQIALRERIDAHKLIEEFMIQANVCAAETLEEKKSPLIYRVHDAPADDKLPPFKDFLHSLDLKLPKAQVLQPEHFNTILDRVHETPHEAMVNEVILRTQSQAVYATRNLGHFGLNLRRYAHFTSPIRRYADLIVHRALISALGFGKDGLTENDIQQMDATAEMISNFERRAMAAERDSSDRYVAAFLSERVGAIFKGRVSGVTRFGLFVSLSETGADGIVPMRSLQDDYYYHDETHHALIGEHHGGVYRLGQMVDVKLVEATPLTGGLRFELLTLPTYKAKTTRDKKRSRKHKSKRGKGKRTTGKRGRK